MVSYWGTYLLSFFTFPMCFKCQTTIEQSSLSSSATSPVVLSFEDCSHLILVNFWCLATMLLICKALVSSAKLLEPPLHCRFFSSSWATCSVNGTSPYVGTEIPSHWDLVEGGVLQLSGCITGWHSDNTNSVCFVSFQSTFICLLCAYWSYPRPLVEQR